MNEPTIIVRVADTFFSRARGLLFSEPLPPGTGMFFPGVRSVHGLMMGRPLEVVFLDHSDQIMAIERLEAGRVCRHGQAWAVIELEAGEADRMGLKLGDRPKLVREALANASPADAAPGSSKDDESGLLSLAILSLPAALAWVVTAVVTTAGAALASPEAAARGPEAGAMSGWGAPAIATVDPPLVVRPVLPASWVEGFVEKAEALYRAGADGEAIDAFAALLDANPDSAAIVILRTGNIHQRSGRNWDAIESYRRALELPRDDQPAVVEARRKALANLAGLLDSVSQQVAEARSESAPGHEGEAAAAPPRMAGSARPPVAPRKAAAVPGRLTGGAGGPAVGQVGGQDGGQDGGPVGRSNGGTYGGTYGGKAAEPGGGPARLERLDRIDLANPSQPGRAAGQSARARPSVEYLGGH